MCIEVEKYHVYTEVGDCILEGSIVDAWYEATLPLDQYSATYIGWGKDGASQSLFFIVLACFLFLICGSISNLPYFDIPGSPEFNHLCLWRSIPL